MSRKITESYNCRWYLKRKFTEKGKLKTEKTEYEKWKTEFSILWSGKSGRAIITVQFAVSVYECALLGGRMVWKGQVRALKYCGLRSISVLPFVMWGTFQNGLGAPLVYTIWPWCLLGLPWCPTKFLSTEGHLALPFFVLISSPERMNKKIYP